MHGNRDQIVLVAVQPELTVAVAGAPADQKIAVCDEALADLPLSERV